MEIGRLYLITPYSINSTIVAVEEWGETPFLLLLGWKGVGESLLSQKQDFEIPKTAVVNSLNAVSQPGRRGKTKTVQTNEPAAWKGESWASAPLLDPVSFPPLIGPPLSCAYKKTSSGYELSTVSMLNNNNRGQILSRVHALIELSLWWQPGKGVILILPVTPELYSCHKFCLLSLAMVVFVFYRVFFNTCWLESIFDAPLTGDFTQQQL